MVGIKKLRAVLWLGAVGFMLVPALGYAEGFGEVPKTPPVAPKGAPQGAPREGVPKVTIPPPAPGAVPVPRPGPKTGPQAAPKSAAGETYTLRVYSAEGNTRNGSISHVFARFTKSVNGRVTEIVDISWLPAQGQPAPRMSVAGGLPGRNYSVDETLAFARNLGLTPREGELYGTTKAVFDRARQRRDALLAGQFAYRRATDPQRAPYADNREALRGLVLADSDVQRLAAAPTVPPPPPQTPRVPPVGATPPRMGPSPAVPAVPYAYPNPPPYNPGGIHNPSVPPRGRPYAGPSGGGSRPYGGSYGPYGGGGSYYGGPLSPMPMMPGYRRPVAVGRARYCAPRCFGRRVWARRVHGARHRRC